MNLVLELPYLPPLPWLALAWQSPVLWLEACEHYQKGSYRNRCRIAGPNGVQTLSVPLHKGKHQQTPIREVCIAYQTPWQQIHWRSICAAYGNAPYFDFYAGDLEGIIQKRFEFLFDLNLELLRFLLEKMHWPGELRLTDRFEPAAPFRNAVSPRAAAMPDWFEPVVYPQVFAERHGFMPGLSALDLLLCCGKSAKDVLANGLVNACE